MNAQVRERLIVGMVEDDPHFSSGVLALLRQRADVRLINTYEAAAPMLAQAHKARRQQQPAPWDLLLMDVGLPDMDGIEATRQLKALYPKLRVLVFTVFEEPATVLAAICAGADGYPLKSAAAEELITAVNSTGDNAAALSGRIATTLMELVSKESCAPLRSASAEGPGSFTPRARGVARAGGRPGLPGYRRALAYFPGHGTQPHPQDLLHTPSAQRGGSRDFRTAAWPRLTVS